MDVVTLPGVFSPHSDSWALADAVVREPAVHGGRVLDLCTGSGVVALAAARAGGRVTAVDVSHRAVENVAENGARAEVKIRALQGDLFEPVRDERFDIITSNPPYVPSAYDDVPRREPERAWAAGRRGRSVLDVLTARALDHLDDGGVLLVVHSSLIGEEPTLDQLRATGFASAEVVDRRRGPLGPLMREQQRLGTIPSTITEEDVVIVRAVAPRRSHASTRSTVEQAREGSGW